MPRVLDIPAYAGGAIEVQSGEFIRITDVEGCQIADMFAVCAADMAEWLGAAHTRGAASRLFPRVGQAFFTNRYRPMLAFVADRSPGDHVVLRAEMDIVLIVTSCSWDLPVSLINGERCTPIRVEVGTAAEIA
jgi:uncharacterized protein YcgI (DUF1989 family)